jgi:hypothetical protein
MKLDTTPIETESTSLYEIVKQGAIQFSNGDLDKIDCIIIQSDDFKRPEVRLAAYFDEGEISNFYVKVKYDRKHEVPIEQIESIVYHKEYDSFKLEAEKRIKSESLIPDIIKIKLDAPFKKGKVEVSLPESADWLDATIFMNYLDRLAINYEAKEELIILDKKTEETKLENLLHVFEKFVDDEFDTTFTIRRPKSRIYLRNRNEVGYSLSRIHKRGILLGKSYEPIIPEKASDLQGVFENSLYEGLGNRQFEIFNTVSTLKKGKGMRIDYS